MNILFYTPMNTRCRDIESQAIEFAKKGHTIFLLTQTKEGPLHKNFASYGYVTSASNDTSSFVFLLIIKRIFHFILYCRKNKIDVVYSHLEPSNFIASIGQFFVKSRIVICRHHMDYAKLLGIDKNLSYKLTYRLAKDIIALSNPMKNYLEKQEKIPAKKIHTIPLSYNFGLYETPNQSIVSQLRNLYAADLVLLSIARLDELKRIDLSISLLDRLVKSHVNAKLLILGDGDMKHTLLKMIKNLKLDEKVFLVGYVQNVLDYMTISHLMIHPSMSEASCISVKEAGLVGLPALVCKNVGDFDEVIEHKKNGFLVDVNKFVDQAFEIIMSTNIAGLKVVGQNLRTTILDKFDIKNVSAVYEEKFHKTRT